MLFWSSDVDFDLYGFIYELDLKIFRCTCIPKINILGKGCQKLQGKSSDSVQCAITGPCLHMRHRPSA